MTSKQNTVSAIIPTHNRNDLLGRAIDSVLKQTVPVEEIIVVDDACNSETDALVDSYGLDNLFYIPNKKGSGASSSRNLGASLAKSKYVAFLDDDDEWLECKNHLQLKALGEDPNLKVVFSRILIKYENTNISYSTRSVKPINPLKEICIENFLGATISCLVDRESFLSVGGFDEHFPAREEYDLWIRLIASGCDFIVIEEALCVSYRSLTRRPRISSAINNYENAIDMINKKHAELVNNTLNKVEQKTRLSKQHEFLAAQAVSIGLRLAGMKYYIEAYRICPNIKVLLMGFISAIHPIILIRIRSILS